MRLKLGVKGGARREVSERRMAADVEEMMSSNTGPTFWMDDDA